LIDHSLFTVQPGAPNQIRAVTDRYGEWQHARYCLYVWLGGAALIVVVTLSRTNNPSLNVTRLVVRTLTTLGVLVLAAGLLYFVFGTNYTVTDHQVMDTDKVAVPAQPASEQPPPLHQAADRGDVGAVKQLLDAGAGVNDKDPVYGQTPLMYAAGEGHTSMVATLILLGADVNEKDKQGQTALMFAVQNHGEAVRKAIEKLVELSQIADAAERQEKLRSFPGVDKRLIAGLDLDLTNLEIDSMVQDVYGESVLMKAVKSKNLAYLRDAVYDYEMACLQDKQGRTPLMHAILLKDPDFIRRIYEVQPDYVYVTETNGFIPDYKLNPMFDPRALSRSNKEGVTALQLAEKLGQDETAKLIRDEMERFVEIATMAIDNEEAKTKYRPQWLNWFSLRGHAYLALGEKEKAEMDFQKARERD
jgi:ankyrin repeat protein